MKHPIFSMKKESNYNYKEFPLSNSFDVFQYSENYISLLLNSLMRDLGIISYLKFDNIQMETFLNCIRNLHSNKVFKNWELSIDRVQFLNYFLKKLNLIKKFDASQKVALFLYLLAMNCNPVISDVDNWIKSKYFLENGSSLNVGTTIFLALSSVPDSPFFLMSKEDQSLLFKTIESLDQINEIDSCFLISQEKSTFHRIG